MNDPGSLVPAPPPASAPARVDAGAAPASPPSAGSLADSLHADVESLEQRRIVEALEACDGNQPRAAQQRGISRGALLSRLKQYGVNAAARLTRLRRHAAARRRRARRHRRAHGALVL